MLKMKSAFARSAGGIASVTIAEVDVPQPHAGEALVRLEAATVNYRDLMVLRGKVPDIKQPRYVPLSDGVGKVVALGENVSRVSLGDRVSPLFAPGWFNGARPTTQMLGGSVDGVARQYAVFDAESLCLIPDEIGDLEAAALPCAGLTAWTALFGARPLRKGEWVLLQGTGGVSIAALQWAKAAGAHVAITSSSDAKLNRARALGADLTINYRSTPDWAEAAIAARCGHAYDFVVDVVGDTQIAACAKAVADGGIIAAVGRLEGRTSWGRDVGRSIIPIIVGNREQNEAMLAFAARHGIRPVIDAVYDLDRLAHAMAHLEAGRVFGKVAVNLA